MAYTVHLYPVVKTSFRGIVADSQAQAIEQAEESADFYALFGQDETEYADEIAYALVDEDGDDEHDQSRWYVWRNGAWVIDPATQRTTAPTPEHNQNGDQKQ